MLQQIIGGCTVVCLVVLKALNHIGFRIAEFGYLLNQLLIYILTVSELLTYQEFLIKVLDDLLLLLDLFKSINCV